MESYHARCLCDLPPFQRLKDGRKALSTAGDNNPILTHSDAVGLSLLSGWNVERSAFAVLCPTLNPLEELLAGWGFTVWVL